jgi:hypothetical protein
VTITEADGTGASLTTTFRAIDGRVDVSGNAHGVALAGDLVDLATSLSS